MKQNNLNKHRDYVDWVFRDTIINLLKNKKYESNLKSEMKQDYFCLVIENNRPSFIGLDYFGMVERLNNTSGKPDLLPEYVKGMNNLKLVVFGDVTKDRTDLIYFCKSDLVRMVFKFNELINQ